MFKTVTSILFIFYISAIYGQKNDYFGSIIIPKSEYQIKLVGSERYWGLSNNKLVISSGSSKKNNIMFIPAGKGFYYIKFQHSGQYLTINSISELKTQDLKKTEVQKFKVIKAGNSKFKFISSKNMAIENTLLLKKNKVSTEQLFEIIEIKSKKKLTIN